MGTRYRFFATIFFVVILSIVSISLSFYSAYQPQFIPPLGLSTCEKYRSVEIPPGKRALCNIGIYINSDGKNALMLLPGIGPGRAQDIVNYRKKHGDFKSIAQLENINGIGPATIRKITPWIEDLKK